jgi:hypothetical protein
MTAIYTKIGDRVSVEQAETLEREFSALEKKYGKKAASPEIDSHCGFILTVFGAGA